MADENRPVIIKRIKKAHHAHHGGSWKVALADMMTAMMAFFLVMWLIGSTTREQKAAIADYFRPIQGPGGGSSGVIDLGGAKEIPFEKGGMSQEYSNAPSLDPAEAEKIAQEQELRQLESLMDKLKQAIEASQALAPFKDHLLLDITDEGLRIQIVDRENRAMFAKGSAVLEPYAKAILREIVKVIATVPNKISLSGHTDRTPYSGGLQGYSNWELSADRANAARRELVAGGLAEDKLMRVVGLADTVLFDKENPYNPINRRISIVVLNKTAEDALRHEGDEVVKKFP